MSFRARAVVSLLCGGAGALPLACIRDRTLFEQVSAGGGGMGDAGVGASEGESEKAGAGVGAAGGGGKTSGTLASPWDEASCVAALSQGKAGDPCVSGFKCSASANCCEILAWCDGTRLSLTSNCDACVESCTVDADCGLGRLCESYQCQDCGKAACPATWVNVSRNGCSVCVPPSQCKSKVDPRCGAEEVCLAGLSCLPGCKGDPECCFGNQCAAASCAPLNEVDCVLVGCSSGSSCQVKTEPIKCACDAKSGEWSCNEPSSNACLQSPKM